MIKKGRQGFASLDPVKHKEIASRGGKSAHRSGRAHQWTSEEAMEAGRKGGLATRKRVAAGEIPEPGFTKKLDKSKEVEE